MNNAILEPKSQEWHAARAKGIGGSDAGKIMEGNWNELWLQKTGRQKPADLSTIIAVQLGIFTESFNAAWFERNVGLPVLQDDTQGLVSDEHPFMRCNLDGRISDKVLFEAKHVGQHFTIEQIIARYYPQCQHNMIVCDASSIYLSVIFGNNKWDVAEIERDEAYCNKLVQLEQEFWQHVVDDIEPYDRAAYNKVQVNLSDMIEIDMAGNNEFAENAALYAETLAAKKKNLKAEKSLKSAMPDNAKRIHGYGIEVKRDRANRISVKEM